MAPEDLTTRTEGCGLSEALEPSVPATRIDPSASSSAPAPHINPNASSTDYLSLEELTYRLEVTDPLAEEAFADQRGEPVRQRLTHCVQRVTHFFGGFGGRNDGVREPLNRSG